MLHISIQQETRVAAQIPAVSASLSDPTVLGALTGPGEESCIVTLPGAQYLFPKITFGHGLDSRHLRKNCQQANTWGYSCSGSTALHGPQLDEQIIIKNHQYHQKHQSSKVAKP